MLSNERMNKLKKIKIDKIKDDGVYWDFSGEYVNTVRLTDEDIEFLRRYYNDNSIARLRLRYRENRSNKGHLELQRDNKYNGCRTKKRIKKPVKKIIINTGVIALGVVIIMSLSSNITKTDSKDNTNYSQVEEIAMIVPEDTMATEIDNRIILSDREEERKEYIRELCDIYQINYDITYQRLAELTDDFNSEQYNSGYIDCVTCKGEEPVGKSEEETLLYAVRCIKQLPSQMGFTSVDDLYVISDYELDTDYNYQIDRYSKITGIRRELVYAICMSESSFKSQMFEELNNPAGLRYSTGWAKFDTATEGIIETILEIRKMYNILDLDYNDISEDAVSQLRDIYAPLSDGNANWLHNVLSFIQYAEEHPEIFNKTLNEGVTK